MHPLNGGGGAQTENTHKLAKSQNNASVKAVSVVINKREGIIKF